MSCASGQEVSQDWLSIYVVRKGISIRKWKEEYEGELIDIDPLLISSVFGNLSI